MKFFIWDGSFMSENIKENESNLSFSNQPRESFGLKSETAFTLDFAGRSDEISERVEAAANLSRIKEAAARLRARLCGGRGIL
jgi:ABC-type sugar transport system ATPase subunit